MAPSAANVFEPRHASELAGLLDSATPNGVIARGLGRSYGDAAQNAGGDVVRGTGLDRVLELDATTGTCTVEAGASTGTFMRVLPPLGWLPMVEPGPPPLTVAGADPAPILRRVP